MTHDKESTAMKDLLHVYTLRINGPLFREQRAALLDLVNSDCAKETHDLLMGVVELLDEVADQAFDQHGIDCLLKDELETGD
jgi:hypothetical protein